MSLAKPNDRLSALLTMVMTADRDHAREYLLYLDADDQKVLRITLEELEKREQGHQKQYLLDEIKRLSNEAKRSILSEVHPDWLTRALLKERPRMMAVILRFLPSEHVSKILDQLPEEVLKKLPSLSQTFSIDPECARYLKLAFENYFVHGDRENRPRMLTFETIPYLNAMKLEMLFYELGYRELAMAFATLKKDAIDLILSRLEKKHALQLNRYIQDRGSVSRERLKKAQNNLLSLNLKKINPDRFILDMGVFVFTKSILNEHKEGIRMIQQKFPISFAKLLKFYLERNIPLNQEKTASPYQEEILAVARGIHEGELL